MGCVSSVPVPDQNKADTGKSTPIAANGTKTAEESPAKAQKPESKSKTTRARRLSYVRAESPATTAENGEPSSPKEAPAEDNNRKLVPQASSNTRARRLSYVTNEKSVTEKLKVEYDSSAEPETTAYTGYDGLPPPAEGTLRVHVGCMSRAGREPGFKKTNQDNCFAFEKYITEEQSLFGAMDGHGPQGHLVSGFVKQQLPILLVNHLTTNPDPCSALVKGFLEVDRSLAQTRIDCEFSGSTAVVAYLRNRTLTMAWVGDSRGCIGRQGPRGLEAVELTVDHKPTAPIEKERILKANGRVERLVDETGQPMGPHRVWLQYAWIPGLAMSRALGDVLAHQVGVISEPETLQVELTPADKFLVMASDGIWEFITNDEAVAIVGACETVEEACRQLVEEAHNRWMLEEEGVVDDITAVVVQLIHA